MNPAFSLVIRNKSGISLVEVLTALTIVSLIVVGMSNLLINCSHSSDRLQIQSDTDSGVALAAERVCDYLAEARTVTIGADGQSISYKYPLSDANGYALSSTSTETQTRSIYLDGTKTKLYASDRPNTPILENIPTTDPELNAPLKVFSTGSNSKEIVVRLVSTRTDRGKTYYSAVTTRVRPRNIP